MNSNLFMYFLGIIHVASAIAVILYTNNVFAGILALIGSIALVLTGTFLYPRVKKQEVKQ